MELTFTSACQKREIALRKTRKRQPDEHLMKQQPSIHITPYSVCRAKSWPCLTPSPEVKSLQHRPPKSPNMPDIVSEGFPPPIQLCVCVCIFFFHALGSEEGGVTYQLIPRGCHHNYSCQAVTKDTGRILGL